MKTILIISFSDLAKDPRVNRQIHFLSKSYQVIAAGTGNPEIERVRFVSCQFVAKTFLEKFLAVGWLWLRKYEKYYWSNKHIQECYAKLLDILPDIIIANDIDSLPLAFKLANGAKVVLDAHEYAPLEFEDRLLWRLVFQSLKQYLCTKYIPKVNAMMTVCQGIADEYERNFKIKPIVVTNAPNYQELKPSATAPKRVRMIHHGGAMESRKIENTILMMDRLDERFEMDLMLISDSGDYIDYLKKLASGNPKIRFIPPVNMKDITKFINHYDIGLYLLEPNNFNHRYALPNKFFEFIQARLAIAISPSPEMAKIVREYDCGVVAEDFSPEALARCLMQLDAEKIDYYKQQSHKIARMMSSEQNEAKLLALVEQVLQQ